MLTAQNSVENVTKLDLTFGEKAVGLQFNPSGDEFIDGVKNQYANMIDVLDAARKGEDNSEKKRMYSIAITELQSSQMWAIKARTWKY
jgi:hypothetical protein